MAPRVPRRALPQRPEPRQRHALRLVAQPLHGLRPPLHLLLRPRLRAARRPPLRRPLRHVDPRQGQRRRGPPPRARPRLVGARDDRDRRRDRPLPARRGPLPADPRLPRSARRGPQPVRHHHARADDRPRHRRPRGGRRAARMSRSRSRSPRSTTTSGARPSRDRAPAPAAQAVQKLVDAGIKAGVGMAPILPGISDKPEQLREVVKAAREAGATGVWTNVLFLRPGTREHFLEHLAEDWPELVPRYERALPAAAPTSPPRKRSRSATGSRRWPASSASPTAAFSRPSRRESRSSSPSRSDRRNTIRGPWPKPPTTVNRRSPA